MSFLTCLLYVVLLASPVQQSPVAYWNKVIDLYETLCEECSEGNNGKEAAAIRSSLDKMLANPVGKMNEEQKARFDAVRRKYRSIDTSRLPYFDEGNPRRDTVVIIQKPSVEYVKEVEHITVIDTVSRIENISRIIVEHQYSRKDTIVMIHSHQDQKEVSLENEGVEEPVKVRKKSEFKLTVAAVAAFAPDFSAGLSLGAGTPSVGAYLKARSNFGSTEFNYSCLSDGTLCDGGAKIWTNGNQSVSRSVITAGAYFKIVGNFKAYTGAGYGFLGLYFQDIAGQWAKVADASCEGLSLDLGFSYDLGRVRFSLGACTTSFRYFDFEAGVGVILF